MRPPGDENGSIAVYPARFHRLAIVATSVVSDAGDRQGSQVASRPCTSVKCLYMPRNCTTCRELRGACRIARPRIRQKNRRAGRVQQPDFLERIKPVQNLDDEFDFTLIALRLEDVEVDGGLAAVSILFGLHITPSSEESYKVLPKMPCRHI